MSRDNYTPPRWASAMPECAGHPDPELWSYDTPKRDDDKLLQAYRIVEALDICDECPVRQECLVQGLREENMEAGTIWGGLMFTDRQKLVGQGAWKVPVGEDQLRRMVRKIRGTHDRQTA